MLACEQMFACELISASQKHMFASTRQGGACEWMPARELMLAREQMLACELMSTSPMGSFSKQKTRVRVSKTGGHL